MSKLRKLIALPRDERALLMRALKAVLAMRTMLWTMNFARVRANAEAMSRRVGDSSTPSRPSPQRIAWAVATASRVVPRGGNCLVHALATGIVLKRYGYPSELKIGVTKPVDGRLQAHAWLESGDSVVIGDFQLDRYVRLGAPESAAP